MVALSDFWSSSLNRAVVDSVDPKPDMVLLDLGAGLGPATIEAAGRVAPRGTVIAVDPSRAMLAVLGVRRLWQRSRSAIVIRRGSAEHLPVSPSSVDAAWAVNATHHFGDLDAAASELARVLRPGGRVLLVEEDLASAVHPYHDTIAQGHEPEAADPTHLVETLESVGLGNASSDRRIIGGVPATVVEATKPADHRPLHDRSGGRGRLREPS
jgi:SAM-dependent methyltransferase